MSTRSSGFYRYGIHLFVEQDSGDLCCDFPKEESWGIENNNEKYDSFKMREEEWLDFANSIIEKIEEARSLK